MTFDPAKADLLATCLFFLLSIIFGVLMIRKFSGTPGQLLCGIHIKDVNTLENITLVQAIIRYVSFEVIRSSIFITRRFSVKYTSKWWFESLSILIIMVIILIFAISDRHKQFFHDKIAKTVAVDYKSSS